MQNIVYPVQNIIIKIITAALDAYAYKILRFPSISMESSSDSNLVTMRPAQEYTLKQKNFKVSPQLTEKSINISTKNIYIYRRIGKFILHENENCSRANTNECSFMFWALS